MRTKKIFLRFSLGILLATPFLFGAVFPAYATRSDISAPAFPSPANGWPTDTFVLQWANSTFPQGSFSSGYLVEFARVPSIPPANDNIENISWEPHWTPTNSFTLPDTIAVDQQYMWRARGCLASTLLSQGNTGDMSAWCGPWSSQDSAVTIAGVPIKGAWTFTPKLGKPTLVSPQNGGSSVIAKGPQGNPSVELKWNKVPGASAYTVAVKVNNNSRNFDISAPSSNPDQVSAWVPSNISILPATTYQWNVTASQGTAIGPQSDSWSFSTSLSQTAPIFPKQGGTIPFAKGDVQFTWTSVPGADGYVFKLFDASGKNLVPQSSQFITQPSFTLGSVSNSLELGKQYTWKVTPSYSGLPSSLTGGPWNFSVVFAPPTNLSPNNVDIPVSLLSKYAFSWGASPGLPEISMTYKWEILNKDSNRVLSGEVNNALSTQEKVSTNIDLTRLSGGTYNWHALTCSSSGIGCSDWSEAANFSLPDFTAPVISSFSVSPQPSAWINAANPNINVSWRVSDTGGSHIRQVEIWKAPYDADICNGTNNEGCSWGSSFEQAITAPAGLDSWQNTYSYAPTSDGVYEYGIHVQDGAGNCIQENGGHCGGVASDNLDNSRTRFSLFKVQIDKTPPTSPGTPFLKILSNPPTWAWNTSTDTLSGLAKYVLRWCKDQSFQDKSCTSNSAIINPPSASFTPFSSLSNEVWYFKVQAIDRAGNIYESSPGQVTIEASTPPQTQPSQGQEGFRAQCDTSNDCNQSQGLYCNTNSVLESGQRGFCDKLPASFTVLPVKNSVLTFNSQGVNQLVSQDIFVSVNSSAASVTAKVKLQISGTAFTFNGCAGINECNSAGDSRTISNATVLKGSPRTYGVLFSPTSTMRATGSLCYDIVGVSSTESDQGCITLQGTVGAQPEAPGGVTAPTGGQQGPCPPGAVCIGNPLSSGSFPDLVNTILDFIFNLALAVVPVMAIVAGFLFLTGGGDPAKLTRARDILLWTAVGFGIILISKGIPLVIKDILGAK